ncbi:protein-lysine N-methyltransferase EEF2KMT [Aphomia sociella]
MNSSIEDNVFRYRHYVVGDDLNNTITIKETNNVVVNGTTGMRTWEAAFMLGDWALCNKELFRDKRVLELGSGVGFTGIVISKFCEPREFIMTDCHNDVLKTICENIKINFSKMEMMENNEYTSFINEKCALGTMYLDWNDMKNISLRYKSPDIIIGADIVYDPSILIPLCRVIQTFAQRNKKIEVYIASVIRNETTFQQFLSTLESTGLVYEKIQQEKSVVIEWDNAIQRCLLKIKLP